MVKVLLHANIFQSLLRSDLHACRTVQGSGFCADRRARCGRERCVAEPSGNLGWTGLVRERGVGAAGGSVRVNECTSMRPCHLALLRSPARTFLTIFPTLPPRQTQDRRVASSATFAGAGVGDTWAKHRAVPLSALAGQRAPGIARSARCRPAPGRVRTEPCRACPGTRKKKKKTTGTPFHGAACP